MDAFLPRRISFDWNETKWTKPMVYPSGLDLNSTTAPLRPPAPGLFFTTTGTPSFFSRSAPILRPSRP